MTAYSNDSGLSANCTLQPPSMPSSVMMLSAEVRSIWYSLSHSVWLGATTTESPVCTPTGSTFSMLQIVIALPLWSRMTSYSISFQPVMHFSTRISSTREYMMPVAAISRSSSQV